jgi:transcriptional regulator with XRE-family HTH domain
MELGKKLRAARQEAALSQRELCGDQITRNMLSQIENGAARPSMDTLQYLAGRLGKSVSFFLEDGATDPEQRRMEQARAAFGAEKFEQVLEQLADRPINPATDWEAELLVAMACLGAAEQAVEQGRLP